jgi:hypothetical protein
MTSITIYGSYSRYTPTFAIHSGASPKEIARKLPRYEAIPGALIGRLTRDPWARERGIGASLLVHAIKRMLVANRAMAVRTILIDAKNQGTIGFHKNFGFVPFPVAPCPVFPSYCNRAQGRVRRCITTARLVPKA